MSNPLYLITSFKNQLNCLKTLTRHLFTYGHPSKEWLTLMHYFAIPPLLFTFLFPLVNHIDGLKGRLCKWRGRNQGYEFLLVMFPLNLQDEMSLQNDHECVAKILLTKASRVRVLLFWYSASFNLLQFTLSEKVYKQLSHVLEWLIGTLTAKISKQQAGWKHMTTASKPFNEEMTREN